MAPGGATSEMIAAWTSLAPGKPSDGDDRQCAGCLGDFAEGDEVWWTGGDDGDMLCVDCALGLAHNNAAIVVDLDSGAIVP